MTRRRIAALAVLCAAVFLVAIDATVLSVAVPAISEQLAPTYTQMLWIGDSYSFVLAALLVTMGNVGDRIGRKRLLLFSAVGFGVMSACAAFAPSAEALIVFRALQGVFGAGLMPPTLALLRSIFTEPALRSRAVGVWAASGAAGAALGPTVAGLLLEHYFWGSVLLINVPVVIVIVLVGLWVLPEARSSKRLPIDLPSVALGSVGILSAVYGITEIAHSGPAFWPGWLALVAALPLLLAFLRRQRRLATPLLDLGLFSDVRFSAAVSAQFAVVFANTGALFFLPIFFRQVEGFSALQSGTALLPVSLVSVVFSIAAPRLISALGGRRVLLIGLTAGSLGLLGVGLTASLPYWAMVGPMALLGFAFGVVLTTASNLVLTSAPPQRVGAATGVSETAFELGSALGIALIGSAVSVFYFLASGVPGDFTAQADPASFTTAVAGAAITASALLGLVAVVLGRALRPAASAQTSGGDTDETRAHQEN